MGGAGCIEASPSSPDGPREASGSQVTEAALTDLEGMTFIRDGSVWTIEQGEERLVARGVDPWSLRSSRSGEAVTWISADGSHASIQTAAVGDWRAETLWETDLGSLVAEAVHDDLDDVVWLTVSGEETGTVGVVDLAHDTQGALALPVDAGATFCLDPATDALFIVSATHQPATLWRVTDEAQPLFEAMALFTPRCSPDGSRVAVTGIMDAGEKVLLWVVDVASRVATRVDTGTAMPADPVWSRDGARLAFRDARAGTIWTAPARGGAASDSGLRADEGGLAW